MKPRRIAINDGGSTADNIHQLEGQGRPSFFRLQEWPRRSLDARASEFV